MIMVLISCATITLQGSNDFDIKGVWLMRDDPYAANRLVMLKKVLNIKSEYNSYCIDVNDAKSKALIHFIDGKKPLEVMIENEKGNIYRLIYNDNVFTFLIRNDPYEREKKLTKWYFIEKADIHKVDKYYSRSGELFKDLIKMYSYILQYHRDEGVIGDDINSCLKYAKIEEDENNKEGYPFE